MLDKKTIAAQNFKSFVADTSGIEFVEFIDFDSNEMRELSKKSVPVGNHPYHRQQKPKPFQEQILKWMTEIIKRYEVHGKCIVLVPHYTTIPGMYALIKLLPDYK